MDASLPEKIKSVGLFKKLTIFAASAWAVIEVIDFFASRYHWPQAIEDITVVVLVAAIPFLAIRLFFKALGFYQWLQILLLGTNVVVAGFFINYFLHKPAPLAKINTLDESSSLLVLPFKAQGDSIRDSYFSEGVTSSLITELTKITQLAVLSESVSSSYRDKSVNLKELAEAGVTNLLQGKVQRLGNTIRVAAQLVDTKTGIQVWANQYQMESTNIFKLQDQISESIAKALKIKLSGEDEKNLNSQVTTNMAAYDLFLKGKYFLNSIRKGDLDSAIHYFERAVVLDPNFAKAYAEMANAFAKHNMFITDLKVDYSEKAFVSSEKALRLDSTLAECYYARAYANWTPKNKFQHAQSIADLRKALKINPKYSDALNLMAKIYLHVGLLEEGLVILKRAKQYDPLNGYILANTSSAYFFMADFPKMMEAVRAIPPGYASEAYYRTEYALALLHSGKDMEAEKIFLEGREKEPNDLEYKVTYAVYLAEHKKVKEAQKIIDELENTPNKENQALTFHHVTYFIGATYALLGNNKKAIEWLNWTADNGFPCYLYFKNDPLLSSLKTDREFQALLERLKKDWEGYKRLADEKQ